MRSRSSRASLRRSLLAVPWFVLTAAQAATVTSNGTGGGNWSAGTSWAGGTAPLPGDDVIILPGDQINLTTNQSCVSLDLRGTLNLNTNTRTLTITGGLSMQSNGSIAGTGASRAVNVQGSLLVNPGAMCTISGITLQVNGTSEINGTLTFSSATATRSLQGDVTVAGSLLFAVNTTVDLGARLIAASTAVIGGGGGTGVINTVGNVVVQVGAAPAFSAITLNCGASTNVLGTAQLMGGTYNLTNLLLSGAGVLDVSGASNTLRVSGDWTNSSTAADPFVEGTLSTILFNGASGTQTITRTLGAETFRAMTVTNTSATVPGVRAACDIVVVDDLDHGSGTFDLDGHALHLVGGASAQVHNFNGGARLFSSAAGASFTITDPANADRTAFTSYTIGDAVRGITLSVTCGRISFVQFEQWGTASFTKTQNVDDVFGGGNHYHGPVTFTAASTASRWRMGDNFAQPDTFVDASFYANALAGVNNNFIVCANSVGNAFYGTTFMQSTTTGGFFVCRQNGNGLSSVAFHGPVVARVTLTGNITFADSDSTHANTVTFNSTVQARSSMTSTGDIYFGNHPMSSLNVSPTGQFIPGTLQGMTSVHFRNVTQAGGLPQELIGISNSRIYCGGPTYPVSFEGPTTLRADTVQVSTTTFDDNADLWGLSHLTFAYSTFNGAVNNFTKQGVGNSSSAGGNTYIAGSENTFTSFGAGFFRMAATVPDDMNGNARYVQTGGGALQPAYNTNCTYAGNISTVGTGTAIQFGVAGSGMVTLDGVDQQLLGEAVQPPLFYRLTLGMGNALTVSVPFTVRNALIMNSGRVDLQGQTATLGVSTAVPGALTYNAGWFHGGALRRWVPTTAITLGAVNGLFPLGSDDGAYRPFWFGSTLNLTTGGTITVAHAPTLSGTVVASHVDASWGNTVLGVSNAVWAVTTTGVAVNGTSARIRYGGQGFDPFVLTDLNASLLAGVVGNHAAATSVAVPLEVNRTGLSTALLSRSWRIGTRNISQSPLPVELIGFDATVEGRTVLLAWSTASEQDNAEFIVERSKDAVAFEEVLRTPGAINSTQLLQYRARDERPLGGLSYYRLKQVDIDGAFTYSDIEAVRLGEEAPTITAFPNPLVDGPLTIVFPADPRGPTPLLVRMVATDGRCAWEQLLPMGPIQLTVDRSAIAGAAGLYRLEVSDGHTVASRAIVIQ